MTAVLDFFIPVLALFAALAGIYFLFRAITGRSAETRAVYNLGKQKARHEMQLDLVRAVFLFIVALILMGVFGFSPRPPARAEARATSTPAQTTATVTTIVPSATATTGVVIPSPAVSPTSQVSPTPSPMAPLATAVPTDTATPSSRTATVSSGVGVWLRVEPSTEAEQLAWLLDGTVVIVLPQTTTGENLAWQEVQTQAGIVGWVAVPFITYNDQP